MRSGVSSNISCARRAIGLSGSSLIAVLAWRRMTIRRSQAAKEPFQDESDGLRFPRLQRDLGKPLQLLCGTEDDRLDVVDVELDHLSACSRPRVGDCHTDVEHAIIVDLRGAETEISIREGGVAQAMAKG